MFLFLLLKVHGVWCKKRKKKKGFLRAIMSLDSTTSEGQKSPECTT